ncbi:MAG: cobalt-precorrin 5A hydrolase [Oscillospiraceae bacterium]|nr:cobalt-precorrin 5A hydrolase [Oscillospiraceae bacterium]
MKIAIISLTERGRQYSAALGSKLARHAVQRYCFATHTDDPAISFSSLSALTADLFRQYDALIFLCACGIAVRMIAPHLRSKVTDPAVLAADDSGQFVIPLVSGHLGGANALAKEIAALTGAQAVITTATDAGGAFSPDCFAMQNDLLIGDLQAAKAIAAAVLDGEMIGFHSDYPFDTLPPELSDRPDLRIGIAVSADESCKPFPVTLQLTPRNLIAGIGCKRGTDCGTIADAVKHACNAAGVSGDRIRAVATVDRKADEAGLLQFCAERKLSLHTYSAEELMRVQGDFSSSAFVMQTVGADNICERSAVLCSGGMLILRKTAANGVTVAIAEKPVHLTFERKNDPCSMLSDSDAETVKA